MLLSTRFVTADCIYVPSFSHNDGVEEASGHINDLVAVIDREHVSAVGKFSRRLARLHVFVDVKAQIFTLTEQLPALCQDKAIGARGYDLEVV